MKTRIQTQTAPTAIGPYSQAIRAKGQELLFLSGQIPIDPATGQITSGDVQSQTEQVLKNLEKVLSAGGGSLNHVVKTTVFLKSLEDFPKMNEVYARYFNENPPARSTVEVSRLPKDVLVEIDAIAVL